jgi:hypothetical protein
MSPTLRCTTFSCGRAEKISVPWPGREPEELLEVGLLRPIENAVQEQALFGQAEKEEILSCYGLAKGAMELSRAFLKQGVRGGVETGHRDGAHSGDNGAAHRGR